MSWKDSFYDDRKEICPCGKVMFSKKDAQTKRNHLAKRGNEGYLRIYQCTFSDSWHVTKRRRFEGKIMDYQYPKHNK